MNITLDAYFHAMKRVEDPSMIVRGNAHVLITKVNALLAEIDLPEAQQPRINSGWRSTRYNATVPGAAPNSKHITGQAIDLADDDGMLDDYLFARPQRLIDHGLYLEHPASTRRWTHLQSVAPRSGNRIFMP